MKKKPFISLILAAALIVSLFAVDGAAVYATSADNGAEDLAAEFAGKTICVLSGAMFDQVAAEYLPDSTIVYANTTADDALALESGRVDAYMTDEPIARLLLKSYADHVIYANVQPISYAYVFPKDNAESDRIRSQLDEFLTACKEDGTLDELFELWISDDEDAKVVDLDSLTGENGELSLGISSEVGAPFIYVKDGQYVGYDIAVAVRFCQNYGYKLKISDYNFSAMLAAVASGKCDFAAASVAITEERKESMSFSVSNYDGGIVIVVKDESLAGGAGQGANSAASGTDIDGEGSDGGFFQSLKASFQKTFIREDRWKLFASGIGITVLITVISAVCGTALAFLLLLLYRKNHALPNAIINVVSDILEKTPVVVILMILYYLVFNKADLDGIWVSCIGFSLIFGCSALGCLKVAVGAVDGGQMEAALALGYTDTKAFIRVILPQAMGHFLPIYQSEIVALIKGTSIMGYIAVQDLTKVSDIVRSRTYEAFFPLIASAVIYFAIAWLLTLIVMRIRFKTDPTRRSNEKVLKGVKTK